MPKKTKSKQKWTVYFDAHCYSKTPYTYIVIQAPRGVSDDVMRKLGYDPFEIDCQQHGGGWWVTEDSEGPESYITFNSHLGVYAIREDAVSSIASGVWKMPQWKMVTNA